MNSKKGFTLVEILAVVAILAVLATAAGLGITSSINKQKQKLAYQAEENIAEAAKSYASNKINNYLKPCVNSDGAFMTITEKKVIAMNKALRESEGIASSNEDLLYQNMKIYSNYANTRDEEKAFLNNYIKVGNKTCFKTITVGELVEQGYIKDDDHMCNKASIVVIYRRADAKNTAGIMDTVQETGICNSKRSSSSGPVITITPFSNLAYSISKSIKITIHSDSTTLKNPLTLNYDFTTSDKKGPNSYTKSVTLTRTGDDELSGTIPMDYEVDKTVYLWIKSGTIMDNKNNKTSTIVTGPYAFSPIVFVTYNKTAGVTGCDEKKAVVFEKQYGKNANNMSAPLCIPEKTGYNFVGWTYQNTEAKITDTSKVKMKLDHYLSDNWEPKVYNVTLDKNGATNTPTLSIKTTYDSNVLDPATITLPIRKYTVKGFWLDSSRNSNNATVSSTSNLVSTYIFNGWNTSATGGSQVINNSSSPALLENVPNYTGVGGIWQRDKSTNKLYANWTSVPVTLPTIAKTGYDCGWTTSSTGTTISNTGGSSYTPTANTTMYGVCSACKYKIIFNKNNTSATGTMSDKECTYDKDCKLTNNAYSLSGYSFNGWNTKTDKTGINYSNGETVKNLTNVCNGTFNLYANWCQKCASVSHGSCSLDLGTAGICKYITSCDAGYTISNNGKYNPVCTADIYTISYELNSGINHSSNPSSYTVESNDITIQNPSRTSYTFAGWTGSNGTTPKKKPKITKGSTGDKSYTAHWCQNCASVSHGSCSLDVSTGVCKYTTSCDAGYTISNNGKYNPVCTAAVYTISYELNSGINHSSNPSSYTVESSDITIQNPSRTSFTFMGWTGSNGKTPKKNPKITKGSTGDKSYTAHWCRSCSASNGATCSVSLNSSNTCVYTTECSRAGYVIANNGKYNPTCVAIKYTIKYDGNGNTSGGPVDDTSCTYDQYCTIASNTFRKLGYTFMGWSTTKSASDSEFGNGAKVKNLTTANNGIVKLYAIWRKNIWQISNPEGGADTIQDAFSQANNNATLTLTKSYSDTTGETNKTLTINLNGLTINESGQIQSKSGGKLTFKGNGKVISSSTTLTADGGTIVVQNGTYECKHAEGHAAAVVGGGYFKMTGGTLTSSTTSESTLIVHEGSAYVKNVNIYGKYPGNSRDRTAGSGITVHQGATSLIIDDGTVIKSDYGQGMYTNIGAGEKIKIVGNVSITSVGVTIGLSSGTLCLSTTAKLSGNGQTGKASIQKDSSATIIDGTC